MAKNQLNKKMIGVTVGIPSYNEEKNIGQLVGTLLKQKQAGFVLEKIIVASDGSSDGTVKRARIFNPQRVEVWDRKERIGVALTQMEIFVGVKSEVLVVLNADIRINDSKFILKLIEPIVKGRADLAAAKSVSERTRGGWGGVLESGGWFKERLFDFRKGNNIYTCRGTARAFSKRLYSTLDLKSSWGDDAYSYIECINRGYKYELVKQAIAIYKLPENLRDHLTQSNRFVKARKELVEKFGHKTIKKVYKIPLGRVAKFGLASWKKHPVNFSLYLLILVFSRIATVFQHGAQATWETAQSTKNLNWQNE